MSSGRKTRYREAVNKQTQSVGNGVCVVCCARCGEGGMQWYLNRALSSGSLQTPDASAESSVNIEKREGKKKRLGQVQAQAQPWRAQAKS